MLPDTEPVDLELLNSMVSRLKAAPPQDIPEPSVEKIHKWPKQPSAKDVKAIISAGGCSQPARRLLNALLDMVQQLS